MKWNASYFEHNCTEGKSYAFNGIPCTTAVGSLLTFNSTIIILEMGTRFNVHASERPCYDHLVTVLSE